jgi:hypothetical protein
MKYPHIPLYTGDWMKDTELSLCKPATRGVWIDLLCAMHDRNRCGELRGTSEQLSRLARCSPVDVENALTDLQTTGAALVEHRNGSWMVANRRMRREADTREKRALAGSIGGSKTQASREQTPDIDNDNGLERVREFSREKGIKERDADWFYWKGKGNGWTNRGEPIRDWKATLLCWFRAGYLPSQKESNGQHAFSKPKERAPSYPKMSESREPTPEEREAWKKSGEIEVAKLREQFGAA